MSLQNRYEFLFYVECIDGNPNGDPDMGNSPRMDPQDMHGFITDVALKRRIRNYVQAAYSDEPGMQIIVRNATNINKFIALANEKSNCSVEEKKKEKSKVRVEAARVWACDNFYDVRTFGAVLSTGKNAGQVRGPVQLTFARSIDAILPLDISITRMQVADKAGNANTVEEFQKWEDESDESKLRTMGRKQLIPYGLYEARGFVSANLAEQTGFAESDLTKLFESILNMYEHDRSASKGQMSVISPLIIFKHIGTDSNETQRLRQAKLGCAPAHKLFDLVSVSKNKNVEFPRSYKDYCATIDLARLPSGVEVGFIGSANETIAWNHIPDSCSWLNGYDNE